MRPLGIPGRRREDDIKVDLKWKDWLQCRALVNTVMKFEFHKRRPAARLLGSQEELCPIELV